MTPLQKRLAHVRKTWGDDTWLQVVGVLAGDTGLVGSRTLVQPLRFRVRMEWFERAEKHSRGFPPRIRGQKYVPWLAKEIRKGIRRLDTHFANWRRLGMKSATGSLETDLFDGTVRGLADTRSPQSWVAVRDWLVATEPDVTQLSLTQALSDAEDWHRARKKKEADDASCVKVWTEWEDGWRVVQLGTKGQLEYEGARMDHCVDTYVDDVANGTSAILSLRDADNAPHGTMEVLVGEGGHARPQDPRFWRSVLQLKGASNDPVDPSTHPRWWRFLRQVGEQRGSPWRMNQLGEGAVVMPVAEKFEAFVPVLDEALGDLEHFWENYSLDPVPARYLGTPGTVKKIEVHPLDLDPDGELADQVAEYTDLVELPGGTPDWERAEQNVTGAVLAARDEATRYHNRAAKLAHARHVLDWATKHPPKTTEEAKAIHGALWVLYDLVDLAEDLGVIFDLETSLPTPWHEEGEPEEEGGTNLSDVVDKFRELVVGDG